MGSDLISIGIVDDAKALFSRLAELDDDARMDAVNEIRQALREHSPMRREPVDCVLWVRAEQLHANDYNPNSVAPPEMRLLQLSIMSDGYTQPIVAWPDQSDSYEVIDGFHRNRVGREVGAVRKRVMGRLPDCSDQHRPHQQGGPHRCNHPAQPGARKAFCRRDGRHRPGSGAAQLG